MMREPRDPCFKVASEIERNKIQRLAQHRLRLP
jgi:hypothetical protein